MKLITATVRTTSLDNVVKCLKDIDIREMTISEIRRIGDETPLSQHYIIHNRIDILIPDEKVEKIVDMILQHTHTGLAGDGFIAVLPVDYMIKIRTKKKLV